MNNNNNPNNNNQNPQNSNSPNYGNQRQYNNNGHNPNYKPRGNRPLNKQQGGRGRSNNRQNNPNYNNNNNNNQNPGGRGKKNYNNYNNYQQQYYPTYYDPYGVPMSYDPNYQMPQMFYQIPPENNFYPNNNYYPPVPNFATNETIDDKIRQQFDYYFSDENLVRDPYLRSQMDTEGFVSLDVLSSFPRVQKLGATFEQIISALQQSTIVEVQEQKVRRRGNWHLWIEQQEQPAVEVVIN
jgi:la-related protein 1